MYQLHAQVTEYPSFWRVNFVFSATDERGRVRPYGTRELFIDRARDDMDPLAEALTALERAVKRELGPIR